MRGCKKKENEMSNEISRDSENKKLINVISIKNKTIFVCVCVCVCHLFPLERLDRGN